MFVEQTQIFQKGLSKRHACFFSRREGLSGICFCLSNRPYLIYRTDTNFPINRYLVIKHKQIFQAPGASIFFFKIAKRKLKSCEK